MIIFKAFQESGNRAASQPHGKEEMKEHGNAEW